VAGHNVLVDRPEKPPSLSEAAEGTYPENYYKEVADEVLHLVALVEIQHMADSH
jgi:hypothetical protein